MEFPVIHQHEVVGQTMDDAWVGGVEGLILWDQQPLYLRLAKAPIRPQQRI